MPTQPVTLIKGDKVGGIDTDYRDALPVNMYAVKRDILRASGYMYQYPGLTSFATGSGIDRGGNYNERDSAHYRVSGEKLISVSTAGVVTELGTITGSSQATLEEFYSFNTQGIIADSKFFLYDTVGGFRQVIDGDLGLPIDGIWIDSYYFMTDGEYLFHTDLADEEAIDPLKFATSEFSPDPSLALGKTQDNKVIVFNRYSIEYFINVAADNFAFQRVATRGQKIGIVATHAKCNLNGKYFFTGGYRNNALGVYVLGVGDSTKISTREIDRVLAQYTETELVDMRMDCWGEKDTSFVLLHLPNETLCFNLTTAGSMGIENAWTILRSGVTTSDNYRAVNGIFDARLGKWLYGDKEDSTIGELDDSVATHYTDLAEWILYTPFMKIGPGSIDQIEIDTIPGFTDFDDAYVAFSATLDGITYGQELWNLYGSPQNYGYRFYMRRLGYVRDAIGFKLRGASRSRMAFALLEVTYG